MVRPCCCWLCPQSRSVWTWSSGLPSSCVTRSSVSKLPSTNSTPTDGGAATGASLEMLDYMWISKLFWQSVTLDKHTPRDSRRMFPDEKLKDYFLGYYLCENDMQYPRKTKKLLYCRLRQNRTHWADLCALLICEEAEDLFFFSYFSFPFDLS